MSEQMNLHFSQNTIRNIKIYHASERNESKTEGVLAKFTPTQKEAIRSICKEHNLNASTFLREALDFYIELFPYRDKIKKHSELLREVLSNLS